MKQEYVDDLFNLLCGEELGRGTSRTVYQCVMNPDWVVKKDSGDDFSNIAEHEMWQGFRGTKIEKWLAPVEWMSKRGLWLFMHKTEPLPEGLMPKKIPAIFTDTHMGNWGWYKGRAVCHDYAYHRLYTISKKSACELVKADFS